MESSPGVNLPPGEENGRVKVRSQREIAMAVEKVRLRQQGGTGQNQGKDVPTKTLFPRNVSSSIILGSIWMSPQSSA